MEKAIFRVAGSFRVRPFCQSTLLWAYNQFGKRWAAIAQHLPGRTDNACKNHFNSVGCRLRRESSGLLEASDHGAASPDASSLGGVCGDAFHSPPLFDGQPRSTTSAHTPPHTQWGGDDDIVKHDTVGAGIFQPRYPWSGSGEPAPCYSSNPLQRTHSNGENVFRLPPRFLAQRPRQLFCDQSPPLLGGLPHCAEQPTLSQSQPLPADTFWLSEVELLLSAEDELLDLEYCQMPFPPGASSQTVTNSATASFMHSTPPLTTPPRPYNSIGHDPIWQHGSLGLYGQGQHEPRVLHPTSSAPHLETPQHLNSSASSPRPILQPWQLEYRLRRDSGGSISSLEEVRQPTVPPQLQQCSPLQEVGSSSWAASNLPNWQQTISGTVQQPLPPSLPRRLSDHSNASQDESLFFSGRSMQLPIQAHDSPSLDDCDSLWQASLPVKRMWVSEDQPRISEL